MKGIVFTEFLDLVEDKFGYETVDNIIKNSHLVSNGAYTSVGTYPHSEMFRLVGNLSKETGIEVGALLRLYGKHLFSILVKAYQSHFHRFFNGSCFEFLEALENHIHVEVLKLYPDAELPRFDTQRIDDKTLEMIYTSERKMSDFAIGLLESCFEYFDEKATVEKENLNEDGSKVKLIIRKI